MGAVTGQDHVENFGSAFAGEIDFLPLAGYDPIVSPEARDARQAELRKVMADEFYGHVPVAPDEIHLKRIPLVADAAERMEIEITVGERRFTGDAALWLPKETSSPVPLICGLDFIGPVGLMNSDEFPIDPYARISPRTKFGAPDNRMSETLRGVSAHQWPVSMMLDAGYGVIVAGYGSWVPDDHDIWKTHGVHPLLGLADDARIGAISLWAWAIQRLVDAAETIEEIDTSRVAVAGHSRLGKAALWAAANDRRIGAVLANNSGCGGSAPWSHPVGETLVQMAERFPHWTIPKEEGQASGLSFDQHHLMFLLAPRALYLAAASSDVWADPIGSYLALKEASEVWNVGSPFDVDWPEARALWDTHRRIVNGALGYHLRPGGHDMLPYDWRNFLEFLGTVLPFENEV